jgi:oxygen-dependent protoporphyrinogen oxidase
VILRTSTPAQQVARRASGISIDGEVFDGVVMAVPAFTAASLLAPVAPIASRQLAEIRYASVALALLSYPAESVPGPLTGSGFLVPRATGMLMTACSWASSKWAHLARPDRVFFRVSAGRIDDERQQSLFDGELVDRLHGELAQVLDLRGGPTHSHVARWPRSFPQYGPGHPRVVSEIESALSAEMPGVILAGAAYRGVGIPACIASGQSAARRLLDS